MSAKKQTINYVSLKTHLNNAGYDYIMRDYIWQFGKNMTS